MLKNMDKCNFISNIFEQKYYYNPGKVTVQGKPNKTVYEGIVLLSTLHPTVH